MITEDQALYILGASVVFFLGVGLRWLYREVSN